jgi:cell wall-associated NlpC family hydrolase
MLKPSIVKNQLLMLSLFTGMIGCTSSKRSASSAATESKPKTTNSRSSSPVFLENISINASGKSSPASKKNTPVYAKGSESAGTGKGVEISEPLQFKYAILLNVPVEEVTDSKLIETIESWYGTRYRFGGNDRSGIDCSAFAQAFMSSVFNISLPRTSIDQYRQSKRIRKSDLQEGDLVFFATRGGRRSTVSHVGVYLRNNKFVHAATSGGVMISDLEEMYYAQHYAGAGRVR